MAWHAHGCATPVMLQASGLLLLLGDRLLHCRRRDRACSLQDPAPLNFGCSAKCSHSMVQSAVMENHSPAV